MAPPRGYPSTLRTEQASLTRSRIIDAARTAFVTNGWDRFQIWMGTAMADALIGPGG